MRALVVTIWVFINLIFFGMCGYMYLLWSQYWMYIEKDLYTTTNNYEQQIYYYNRGLPLNETVRYTLNSRHQEVQSPNEVRNRTKHAAKDLNNVTIIKNSKPRFPNLQGDDFLLDTHKYQCWSNESKEECAEKIKMYKEKLLNELKRVFMDESNVLKSGSDAQNPYDVHYKGARENYFDKDWNKLVCELKDVKVETLRRVDKPFSASGLKEFLPKKKFLENKRYKSCAVIASSGSLHNSNLGEFIDSHEMVLRFNHAPTAGFESDVGRKTTMRILNSQVVSKEQFKFLEDDLFRNVTLLAWDPSNYTSSLEDWYRNPEFNLFPNYVAYRRRFPRTKFYLLNPRSLWNLWDFLQSNSPSRLRRNPPSSGFLGIAVLLRKCSYVNVFEYVPSTRVSKRCHYYDSEENPACTFGVWHPLAAEKLLAYNMNVANDTSVFRAGFIRITGFSETKC